MARFVILRHESPRGLHWDFMLETGSTLKTWALDHAPDAGGPINATALADHRLAYLNYEGPVSGHRGTVTRWDQGLYRIEQETPTQWAVALEGERLRGHATLTRSPASPQHWEFSWQGQ
jgi:hypothetical protein